MVEPLTQMMGRLWRRLFPPRYRTLKQEFHDYLGRDFLKLETHAKKFPGYDLASVNLALNSFLEDCAEEARPLGGCSAFNVRQLFDMFLNPYNVAMMPFAAPQQRIPVDVEREDSFPTNTLTLCRMRFHGEEEDIDEKVAVLLATSYQQYDYWDGMDSRHTPSQDVCLSIACRSRETADRFFTEVEQRRKKLSIYRGKFIDPVVGPAGVVTIGFRPLHKIREHDLILSESLKNMLHSSILNFYQYRDTLEEMGIDLKRGILFHGPPGTGKTSISLYLANLLPNFTVCFVSGERLLYPRELCRMARYLQPAMIVFEDIDLVAQERQANGLATVLGELMNQIDGCEPSEQVLFIMNTNSLERLEHAVKNRPGRVDQLIEVPLPNHEERRRLLEHFTRNIQLTNDLDKVVRNTEGTTPAMLKEIVKRAVVSAISQRGQNNGEPLSLTDIDLMLATEQVRAMRDPEIVPGSFGFREGQMK